MTVRIEALTLEEAYKRASVELSCSVLEMEVQILQYPRRGVFGFGKRLAVISALAVVRQQVDEQQKYHRPTASEMPKKAVKFVQETVTIHQQRQEAVAKTPEPAVLKKPVPTLGYDDKVDGIIGGFYRDERDIDDICYEIRFELLRLFDGSCFVPFEIIVEPYCEGVIQVSFFGPDSALLIGKEGYRYKALSYMLHNWISTKYELALRLEIASFLQNQEDAMRAYLSTVIERAREQGSAQTKPLDALLARIAIDELRSSFGEKAVSIKTLFGGDKIVGVTFRR